MFNIFFIQQVKRVLPQWMKNPIDIAHSLFNDQTSIDDSTELSISTKTTLKKNKIEFLFPVQQTLIPFLVKNCENIAVRFVFTILI